MSRKKQEMPYLIAQRITSTYHCVPQDRTSQETLIRIRYTKLRGTPLDQCSQGQIHAVAEKMFHESYLRVNGVSYREAFEVPQCRNDYHTRLYDMFNIPAEQRNSSVSGYIHPGELEKRLLD